MRIRWQKFLLVGIIVLFVLGCELMPQAEPAPVVPEQPTLAPPPTQEPPPSEPEVEAPPDQPEAEAEIVHVSSPSPVIGKPQLIADQPSNRVAPEKRAYGGDEFTLGRFERPFTAEEMEYLPFIDIEQTVLFTGEDEEWLFTGILVIESPSYAGERTLIYGIELDTDLDGRGDVLVTAALPPGNEWTTEGVKVLKDINNDIGSAKPMRPDAPAGGDGYEVVIFDAGVGEDADLAWARRSPEEPKLVEIAFKIGLVEPDADEYGFSWAAWAWVGEVHPDWVDHHDHFTLEEAGSSLKDNDDYPLKAFHSADNTCRALSGAKPAEEVPGLCVTYAPSASSGGCPPQDCPSFNFGSQTVHTCWNPDTCECEYCRE